MGILIDNRQANRRIPLEDLRKKALAVLSALGNPEAELSLVFVNDDEIADLNRQYLKRDGATNVIAFPMQEGAYSGISPHLLGDVVISVDTAAKESTLAGIDVEARIEDLLIHGILHLFGYDHESNQDDARIMEEKHQELIKIIRPHGK